MFFEVLLFIYKEPEKSCSPEGGRDRAWCLVLPAQADPGHGAVSAPTRPLTFHPWVPVGLSLSPFHFPPGQLKAGNLADLKKNTY